MTWQFVLAAVTPERMSQMLQSGGYLLLFGFLFLCGMGLPIPEDIPLIASGVLISQGLFHIWLVAPIAWLGIIGGDCILYILGYKLGPQVTKLPLIGHHVTVERLKKVERYFE